MRGPIRMVIISAIALCSCRSKSADASAQPPAGRVVAVDPEAAPVETSDSTSQAVADAPPALLESCTLRPSRQHELSFECPEVSVAIESRLPGISAEFTISHETERTAVGIARMTAEQRTVRPDPQRSTDRIKAVYISGSDDMAYAAAT